MCVYINFYAYHIMQAILEPISFHHHHDSLHEEKAEHGVDVPVDRREVVNTRQVLFECVLESSAGEDESD